MKSFKIKDVQGLEVIDSRGNPTVEAVVLFEDGSEGRAIVPSGASKGKFEALELRDGDAKRFQGKGTLKAIHHIEKLMRPQLVGKPFETIDALDSFLLKLDGTEQKTELGANSILAVSMAFANAIAVATKTPLFLVFNQMMGLSERELRMPHPLMNILNGGVHANNGLEIQEFMIVPHGFTSFAEALRAGCEVFQTLKTELHDLKYSTAVGDEGGFAPSLASTKEAIELILKAIEQAGYRPSKDISLAFDVASSSFFNESTHVYDFRLNAQKSHASTEEMIQFYETLCQKYPVISIEDGLEEQDWNGWKNLTEKLGKRVQLVGDDLFVTQTKKVAYGIENKIANAVLIKVNQIGSLKETFETMALAKKHGYKNVVSHRSGETEDVTIAHLAVGSGCGQIKTGSLSRGERTAKYNQLLRIEKWAKENGKPIIFSSN